MKKLLSLTATLLVFSSTIYAQSHSYFAFGYNLGMAKFDSLNYVIDRYNETRTYLDEEMGNVTFPNGFAVSFGGSVEKLLLDLTWAGKHRVVSAEGVDGTGQLVQRDLKFRMNTLNFGLGFSAGKRSIFGLGLSVDLGPMKIFTRVGPKEEIKTIDYTLISKELMVGSTIFINIILGGGEGAGLMLRPYVQLPYFTVSMYEVNAAINPFTYYNDPGLQETKLRNFGVQLAFALYGVR